MVAPTYTFLASITQCKICRTTVRNLRIGLAEKRELFGERSELCEAQKTRGSKFTCEFGRNSTVYCFVASDN